MDTTDVLNAVQSVAQEVKQDISNTELNRNIYDNPPPLTQTLFGTKDKKPDAEGSTSFFNQAALTVGSLLLVGVFLVVSGGSDLANLAAPRRTQTQVQLHAMLGFVFAFALHSLF